MNDKSNSPRNTRRRNASKNVDTNSDAEDRGNYYHSTSYVKSKSKEEISLCSLLPNRNKPAKSTTNVQTSQHVLTYTPSVKDTAASVHSIVETWKLYISGDIISDIVRFTNMQLDDIRSHFTRLRDVCKTDEDEIYALIGLLYLAGLMKSSHVSVRELWATDGTAPEYFRLCMSLKRFQILLRALSFSEIDVLRKPHTNLDPLKDVFEKFMKNCQQHYEPGSYCTIGKIIEPFSGKCSFSRSNRSDEGTERKRGVQLEALVDAETFYLINAQICVNKTKANYKIDHSQINSLITPIVGSQRNVTYSSKFVTVPLVKELSTNHNLSCIGRLSDRSTSIPTCFRDTSRSIASNEFAFYDDLLLVSHIPKKHENLILLSSLIPDNSDNKDEDYDAVLIDLYNLTRDAVSVADSIKNQYSVSRMNNRWPLTIFFTLLNIAGMNSQIVHKLNTVTNDVLPKREYLKQLALTLTKAHLLCRSNTQTLPFFLHFRIKEILEISVNPSTKMEDNNKAANVTIKCGFCPRRKNRKTKTTCTKCDSPICGEHTTTFCFLCAHLVGSSD